MKKNNRPATDENYYRGLFDDAHDAIVVFLADGLEIIDANCRATEIYGHSREELLGMKLDELTLDGEAAREFVKKVVKEKKLHNFETVHVGGDGQELLLEINAALFDREGRPAVICHNRDITLRKYMEDALKKAQELMHHSQKMESIGELAGGVAHDFNNILMGVNGYLELALNEMEDNHPARKRLEEVKKASDRASKLTNELLSFSRRQMLSPKIFSPNEVIKGAEKRLTEIAGADVKIHKALQPQAERVKTDPERFEDALARLVENAAEAMPGGGKITLETQNILIDEYHEQKKDPLLAYPYSPLSPYLTPGEYVMIAVSDTGTGIEKEVLPRIFEPFFTTGKRPAKSGLGLSTVYGFVKQSTGDIRVYTEPGHGSTFKIYIPVAGEEVAETKPYKRKQPKAGTETVLLVENEELVRNYLRMLLEKYGYNVLIARHGVDAMRVLESYEDTVHLLLTDIVMPEMNGRELATQAVKARPGMRLLFMSGYPDQHVLLRDILEKEMPFIQKPLNPFVLLEKIRNVLDN